LSRKKITHLVNINLVNIITNMFYIDKIEQIIFAVIVIYIISIVYNDTRIMGTSAIFALIVPNLDEAIYNNSILTSIILGSVLVYLSMN
jgi:hypothetical protein